MIKRMKNLWFFFLLGLFIKTSGAPAIGRSILDQIPHNADVAIQVMQLKKDGDDISGKGLFITKVKKSLMKSRYPGNWRLPDSGTYYAIKQVEDMTKDTACQFQFFKQGDKVGFKSGDSKGFIGIHKSHKRVPTTAGGLIKKWVTDNDKGVVLVDNDGESFDKWTQWTFEPDTNAYGNFRLKSTMKGADGYLCAPNDRWNNGAGILWVATNQDVKDKDNFEHAKKADALVLKIHLLSGPSVKEQYKAPVHTTASRTLNALPAGEVVALVRPMVDDMSLLRVDGGRLSMTGKSFSDKNCQFKILRTKNWLGFKTVSTGKTWQSGKDGATNINDTDFDSGSQYSCEPVDPSNARSYVRLRSNQRKGYMVIHKKDNRLWTTTEKGDRPTTKEEAQLWRIVKISEVGREL